MNWEFKIIELLQSYLSVGICLLNYNCISSVNWNLIGYVDIFPFSTDEQQTNNLCEQIYDSTNCAPQTKYGYDKSVKKCVEFSFSGCLGNRNNYDTMADCEARHSKD